MLRKPPAAKKVGVVVRRRPTLCLLVSVPISLASVKQADYRVGLGLRDGEQAGADTQQDVEFAAGANELVERVGQTSLRDATRWHSSHTRNCRSKGRFLQDIDWTKSHSRRAIKGHLFGWLEDDPDQYVTPTPSHLSVIWRLVRAQEPLAGT